MQVSEFCFWLRAKRCARCLVWLQDWKIKYGADKKGGNRYDTLLIGNGVRFITHTG